jgi:hypothetical protein
MFGDRDPYRDGYHVEIKPVKKSEGDFWAGVIVAILALALFGWLHG